MATAAVRSQVDAKWQEVFARLNRGQPGISGLMTLSEAWNIAVDFLRPRELSDVRPRKHNTQLIKSAFDILGKCRMLSMLLDNFLEDMRKQEHLVTRDIEAYMEQYEETSDPQVITELVNRLVEWHKAWSPVQDLGGTVASAYNLAFQTHVFSVLPPSFPRGFKALVASTLPSEDSAPLDRPKSSHSLWQSFEVLGLVDRYESLVASVCYEHIENYVIETCAGKWSEQMLHDLRVWMGMKVVPWMLSPYARGAKSAEEARNMLQGVGSRFDFHICKTLCDIRTEEIFDIIVDYPDSQPALHDLKDCLQRVDQRSQLVQTLRKANKKRLLHPGADTKDILSQYVSIIRCLRIVDPPGVLLFKVADPIRRYLRERPDTIRCIVASLVGDSDSGDTLVDDNDPLTPLQAKEVEDYADPNWEPEPIDAGPDFRTNKPSDVISTLVSIYDSKDLFVKELQVLLAQRLLAINDGNYEKERRNIEILKVRFGEAALQVCEVMLRDMTDSRRIDQHVQSQKPSALHPTIISKNFWPSLQSGHFTLPAQLQEIRDSYSKEFSTFKPDKKLAWLPHLGTLKMEIELEDRTVDAEVSPLAAALIELFSEKSVWTVNELIARLGRVDGTSVLKSLTTWIDLGVLKEENDSFRLLEVAEEASENSGTVTASRSAPLLEDFPAVETLQQQQAEQMKVFWKFIEGMLTNLGQLSLDRIQSMLKFAPGYDRNIEQLGMFMESARREQLVVVKDGLWRLQRP